MVIFYAKIARNWIIIVISTLVYALVYNFAQWWFINYSKDIINVAQLKWYKFANFGQNNQILYKNREKLENICNIYI